MKRYITKTVLAAILAVSVATPSFSADGKTDASNAATSSTSTATNTSQGLTSAYNYDVPSPASSTCCGTTYDHGNANGNATIIMTNFNQKLAAMQLAIIEALRLGTGQLSGNIAQQTGAQHTLADQQDDRSTVKAVEDARMKALVDATSGTTSCYVITGSGGGSMAGAVNNAATVYASELDKWVRGEHEMSKGGQSDAEYNRLDAYCKSYATQADVEAKLCDKVGQSPAASVNASASLFYKGSSGISDVYDQKQAEAVNAFIMNTVSPTPFTPQTQSEARSPEGRLKAARYKTQMARESVGRHIMTEYAKARDPQNGNLTLKDWAAGRVSHMQGYQGVDLSNLSYHQWLAIYAKGFLLDSQAMLSSDQNTATAIKDMKNMLSVLNYVAFEQLEQQQKMNLQLATQTAILNESTRSDGIFRSGK